MIVQFLQDYSDRQMEQALAENIAVKWYGDLEFWTTVILGASVQRLGTHGVADIFREVTRQFRQKGRGGQWSLSVCRCQRHPYQGSGHPCPRFRYTYTGASYFGTAPLWHRQGWQPRDVQALPSKRAI